jgi:lysophospholipase-2
MAIGVGIRHRAPTFVRAACLMSVAGGASVKPRITQDKARNGLISIAPAEGTEHTATFIGPIHGLGDTNMGWADAAHQLHTSKLQHVKFVLPNAPTQPVTLNMGMAMPSWYDITSLDDRANQECEGIEQSRATVTELIEEELAGGMPLSRIVVGGFSQGGAMALYTGLQYCGRLAGVVCMSGYLPKDHSFTLSSEAKSTPVAHFHGIDDPTVRIDWARQARQKLLELGVDSYELKEYAGLGHGANTEELADLEAFLLKVLPPQ